MKTLKDLAQFVSEKEAELAPGSETIILGGFVSEYDYVSSILNEETELDISQDETEAYELYKEAYSRMARFEADGVDYDNDMLW